MEHHGIRPDTSGRTFTQRWLANLITLLILGVAVVGMLALVLWWTLFFAFLNFVFVEAVERLFDAMESY